MTITELQALWQARCTRARWLREAAWWCGFAAVSAACWWAYLAAGDTPARMLELIP
jgi:hypothetical protein